jgi:septum formation protein
MTGPGMSNPQGNGGLVYLASRSPRRRELLDQIGIPHQVLVMRERPGRPADVDETPLQGESPDTYVQRVCRTKSDVAWTRLSERGLPPRPVIAADTIVCLDGRIFGKPVDGAGAADMLRALSGRQHRVLTALAIRMGGRLETAVSESLVTFSELDETTISAYIASGESMDKAGAYGIQGRAAAFIPELRGSYSGVMGLPLHETALLLDRLRKNPGP